MKNKKAEHRPEDGNLAGSTRAARKVLGLSNKEAIQEGLDESNLPDLNEELVGLLLENGEGAIKFDADPKQVKILVDYWTSLAVQHNPVLYPGEEGYSDLERNALIHTDYPYSHGAGQLDTESLLPFHLPDSDDPRTILEAVKIYAAHACSYSDKAEDTYTGGFGRVEAGLVVPQLEDGTPTDKIELYWSGQWTEGRFVTITINSDLSSELRFSSATGKPSSFLAVEKVVENSVTSRRPADIL